MQSVNRALLLGVMVMLATSAACGGGEEEAAAAAAAAAAEVEVSPEAIAAAERLSERLAAGGIQLVPTQRGQAEIGYTQPVARIGTGSERGFNITSIRIQNLSLNAIAGFQVDEFWYDTDGNTVTGDQARRRQPILIGEVCDIELRVPRVTAMDRSNYEFSHQNGDIKATLLEDIEDPPQPEVEEGEEAEAEETEEAGEAEGEEAEPTEEELRFTCLRPAEMTDEPAAVEDNAG